MRSDNQSRNWRRLVILSGFLVTFVFVCTYLAQPTFFSLLGLKAYDAMLGSPASEKKAENR